MSRLGSAVTRRVQRDLEVTPQTCRSLCWQMQLQSLDVRSQTNLLQIFLINFWDVCTCLGSLTSFNLWSGFCFLVVDPLPHLFVMFSLCWH